MRKKKYFVSLAAFAIVALLVVSFVAIAAYTAGERKAELTAFPKGEGIRGSGPGATKAVVWDNGMHYENLLAAQIESDPSGIDAEPADDFEFATDQLVNDVHWIGGYFSGPPNDGDFDWRVTFYNDDGTGTKPGAVINTWDYSNAQVNETFIEYLNPSDPDLGAYYSYSVTLPSTLTFAAGTKYWMSVQGLGDTYPQSGWAFHENPILLHQAVFRSVYFSFPSWTNTTNVIGYAVDMCFQLTYEGEEWPDHKMHFPQLPDLIGWDVLSTAPIICADDWQCSRTGPVEDIHFWGSWKDLDGIPETDDYPEGGEMPEFAVFILRNIPADLDTPWSRPGEILWEWWGLIGGTPFDPPTLEGWMDPSTGEVLYNNHTPYWRYDFVDIPDPFMQYEDSIYWLAVATTNVNPPYEWGWKNSTDHFMDDATWSDDPYDGPWFEIYEPPRYNEFTVEFGPAGVPTYWDGTNYYGAGFYEYEYWWNMWFYDNPFTWDQPKIGEIFFWVDPIGPEPWLEFAINWSSPEWDTMGMGRPPLPGVEEMYVERQIIGPLEPIGQYTFPIDIPYNPEWISVDFNAMDVVIGGHTYHECVGTSLDLAFVITGPECTPHIDVEKKVWDDDLGYWVDTVDVDVCNDVDFVINILNDGTCDLTDIFAEDFMDSSLEFVHATPYPDIINPVPGGTYLEWNFPGPLLPGRNIEIYITAHVVGPACHLDSNYVFVHASYEPQAIEVYDEDAAWVHATEEPWQNHKMHFPQLPDPEGWDVVATQGHMAHPGIVLADDFRCTESGPITDIHIWGSWMWNIEAPILGFWLSIHDNIPGPPYSMPGAELWRAYITDYDIVQEPSSLQGWFDPFEYWWEHPNHDLWYRYDIDSIPEPFVQDSGTIYWLNVMADLGPPGYQGFPEPPLWGWKTSTEHFEDDACWAVWTPPVYDWFPLMDPRTGLTLDLAFVITSSGVPVICGDVNNDGIVNVGDIVYLVSYLYKGGPAPVPLPCVGDVNNDDIVNVGDIVYLVSYLYKGGPVPNPNCCNPPWKK
jgi:hypothetical protein